MYICIYIDNVCIRTTNLIFFHRQDNSSNFFIFISEQTAQKIHLRTSMYIQAYVLVYFYMRALHTLWR